MESIIAALLLLLIFIWTVFVIVLVFAIAKVKRIVRNAFTLVFTFKLTPKFKRLR